MPDLTPLFGLLIIDRDPFTFADLPGLAQAWLMDAGGFAFVGLILYLSYVMLGRRGVELKGPSIPADPFSLAAQAAVVATAVVLNRKSETTPEREYRYPLSPLMLVCFAAALVTYAVYGFLVFTGYGLDYVAFEKLMRFDPTGYNKYTPPVVSFRAQPLALSLGGLFATLGIGAPFFGAMAHLVRRAGSTGRAPVGTPGLGGSFALMLGLWVGIGVAAWGALRVLPAAREWIGVGAVLGIIGAAGWAAYRCRLWDRLGAVFAVAKLTVLEVIRNRVFLALLLPLVAVLFPITWFIQYKPEDELRLIISVSTLLTVVVVKLLSVALASFAIPNDVKNQNIYTVLTKPVQPFDVVLGRFLGFTALATVALAAMTAGSWLLIEASNIGPRAKEETFKARVPIRGQLRYESRVGEIQGTDVGREFNYRKYIAGHPTSSQRAIWSFGGLPSTLQSATDAAVPVEFTFDIYRLTKGVENRGVDVNIRVTSWRCGQKPPTLKGDGAWQWTEPAQANRYEEKAKDLLFDADQKREPKERRFGTPNSIANPKAILARAVPGTPDWAVANELAQEFGFFEIVSKEVFDYHPTTVLVPAGLFAHAAGTKDADGKPLAAPPDPVTGKPQSVPPPHQVMVYVKCDSSSQMLGMAEGDLYLLEAEQSFGQNFFKAAFGLWCRLVLLIGLAVVCSTYLVGVVSFLAAGFIFVAGYFGQYITELAMGKNAGGGPIRALSQLSQAKLPTAPDDGTAGARAADLADNVFAWLIRRVVNLFPDVYAFDWTPFLAEGFNVSFENLAMNLIVTVGYLLPWLILGFYLIRSREVAA